MASKIDVQVRNGVVTITIGARAGGSFHSNHGGDGPGDASSDTGLGGPGPGNCCAPTIIGPIVISGSAMQGRSGHGGDGPGDASSDTGLGGPGDASADTGLGAPASGCGCAPTIIGPIVIGSCSGSSASTTGSAPTIVSVAPPANVHGPAAATFTMQPQQESDWCWSAVATSINTFLESPAPADWTQGKLATPVLEKESQIPSTGVDCSLTPDLCNYPAALNDALGITGNLNPGGALFNKVLDFASIQKWVDAQLPIGARILWPGGGAHFIALGGYRVFAGQQQVHVEDPLYGPSYQNYEDLLDSYLYGGAWNDTYLVQP